MSENEQSSAVIEAEHEKAPDTETVALNPSDGIATKIFNLDPTLRKAMEAAGFTPPETETVVYKFATSEGVIAPDEPRTLKHIITTDRLDRDGERIRADGWNFDNYRRNPVVLYAHDWYRPPIGKNVWLKPQDVEGGKAVIAKTLYADTPDGRTIYELGRTGFMPAVSVGFLPDEWKDFDASKNHGLYREYLKQQLLEYSMVSIPANPDATMIPEGDSILNGLERVLREGRVKSEVVSACYGRACELLKSKGAKSAAPESVKADPPAESPPEPKANQAPKPKLLIIKKSKPQPRGLQISEEALTKLVDSKLRAGFRRVVEEELLGKPKEES
jgi:HK97 family phage prohead protease